ncbi:MAG: methylglyoxal synthase [Bacteriovoracaceae bacterium]
MKKKKRIALIAHDKKKKDLITWVKKNKANLVKHTLFATGTTGQLIEQKCKLSLKLFKSGPLGGDQQIASKIAEQKIDILVFFWDPLTAMPHDPDIKALLRLATLYNIAIACNETSADFMIQSALFSEIYDQKNHLE